MSSQPASARLPAEHSEVESRIVSVGTYLLSAGTTFFFIAFLFAFFYLRALNSNGLWAGPKPGHHVPVPTASGIAILVCVLVSVALVRVGLMERGDRFQWRLGAGAVRVRRVHGGRRGNAP